MADNVTLDPGTGGDDIAADDIAGVKHQRVKVQYGDDGSATDVSDTNPLPVDDAGGSLTVDNAALSVTGGGVEASALRVTLANDSTGVVSVDDGGGALTVDGTVTANAGTGTFTVDGSGVTQPISHSSLAVTGPGTEAAAMRVTLASDSTGVVSIDDNGGSLTIDGTVTANLSATDNAVLDNIDADTTTIAGAVSGTEMQVDVVAALPAGTNAIGKLAANSGVDIGDVDVLSVTPGTAATALGKAEDAAHTTGDVGVMALGVRVDSGAALAGTDGDYSPFQVDANGALRVTGGGGGTEYVVNAAAPADPTGTASLMERDDALSTLTEVEGDWTNMRASANGALWTAVDGTVTVDGSGVTQPVSGTVTANLSATDNAVLDNIDADTSAIQTAVELIDDAVYTDGTGTPSKGLGVMGTDGTNPQLISTNATGHVNIADGGNSLTVDGTVTADAGTGPWPVTDNGGSLTVDNAALAVTGGGVEASALRVTLANDSTGVVSVDDNGSTISVDDGAGSLTVDGTVSITGSVAVTDNAGSLTVDNGGTFAVQAAQSGTWDIGTVTPGTGATNLGKAEDAVHATGDTGVMALAVRNDTPSALAGTSGDYIPFTTDSAGRLHVSGPVTQSGTWNVGTVTTVTTVSTLTGGAVAHDAVDSGNPIKVGARGRTSDIAAVADGDRTNLAADSLGHVLLRPYALHENLIQAATAAITTTAATQVFASAGAGRRNYITSLTVINSHASVSTLVEIRDGTSTVIHRGWAKANGGGYSVTFLTPLRGSAATVVNAYAITTGSNVYVSASGYTAAN